VIGRPFLRRRRIRAWRKIIRAIRGAVGPRLQARSGRENVPSRRAASEEAIRTLRESGRGLPCGAFDSEPGADFAADAEIWVRRVRDR